MTEKLEQTLSKVIEKSLAIAEQTGEFVIEQAPDLLQQFYMWHTAEALYLMALGTILIISGLLIPRSWGDKEEPKYYDVYYLGRYYEDEAMLPTIAFNAVFITPGFIMFFVNLHSLLYILAAPKLYLIEYFIK